MIKLRGAAALLAAFVLSIAVLGVAAPAEAVKDTSWKGAGNTIATTR